MRRTIRTHLIENVPSVNGRVYEPYIASPSTERPYLVVKMVGESSTNIRYGFDVPLQIWLYTDRANFYDMDQLATEVANALAYTELVRPAVYEAVEGGDPILVKPEFTFYLLYSGASMDFYDEDWQAYVRRLSFRTSIIRGG